MAKRKDGKETRQKLLDVACEIFAEKGYGGAKVSEICRRAGANVAAVNYYFGGKTDLYVAAWKQAMQQFMTNVATLPEDVSSEEQLAFLIHRFIAKVLLVDGEKNHFRRLELMEMANPTGLIDEAWKEEVAPRREELHRVVRQVMGSDVPETTVRLCELSIVNQCRGYILLNKNRADFLDHEEFTADMVNQIAEHTIHFSLAGIKAIRDLKK
ncbi:TetR family transcriptional regulator [Desulfosarcina widdelii]|uniref:TetR family transcriptional regulator n=1 Tax=Desulfosarcina widdelii TaxID=947919 RepID=A0A5K7Z5R8_9BACT|nr:CerR family C-terminal domain-containing protein [Desulfosarcina widdelii]BBO75253.1 TetR family transcriptional regulator [Desulfosarcina widdelii]